MMRRQPETSQKSQPQETYGWVFVCASIIFIVAAFYFVFIPLYELGRAMGPCIPNSAGNCTSGFTLGTMG